jgi:hypothetical protein
MNLKSDNKNELWLILATVLAIFIFYVLTIRSGHNWGGDFSLYIHHALNLVSGKPYSDTGYILNPYNPWISPAVYPPVFPVLLAPVVAIFGINFYAMKIYLIGYLCASLIVLYRLIVYKIESAELRWGVILIAGLCPWFWDLKDNILSEFVFMFFMLLFMLVGEKLLRNTEDMSVGRQIKMGLIVGLLGYLAYGSRTIGVILVPCFVFAYLVFNRKFNYIIVVSVLSFAVLFLVQERFMDTNAAYAEMVQHHQEKRTVMQDARKEQTSILNPAMILQYIKRNIAYYDLQMTRYWTNGFSEHFRNLTYILTVLLMLTGFLLLIFRKNVSELISLGYIGLLLAVPFLQGNRYLLPIIPLYILYVFKGLEAPFIKRVPVSGHFLFGALMAIILASYAGAYSGKQYGPIRGGVEDPASQDIFRYIRENIPENARIVFKKPRVLALFTGRPSFVYEPDFGPENTWKMLHELNGEYVLMIDFPGTRDNIEYRQTIRDRLDLLEKVYSNENFTLYKILK